MHNTAHHYLLTRGDYHELLNNHPDHLETIDNGGSVYWIEERMHKLGPDSPVRLFFKSATIKKQHQLETIDLLANFRNHIINSKQFENK